MKKIGAEFFIKTAVLGALLFVVFNFSTVKTAVHGLSSVTAPLFGATVLTAVLSVPYNFFEQKLFQKITVAKLRKSLSLFLTLLLFGGIAALLARLLLPQAINSLKEASERFVGSSWQDVAVKNGWEFIIPYGEKIYPFLAERADTLLPLLTEKIKNLFGSFRTLFFALFLSLFFLGNKDTVTAQVKKLFSFLPSSATKKIGFIFKTFYLKFAGYLGGQVLEAILLGTVCYLLMLLLNVPFPALIGVIIGFVNLIPIVGAYVGGAVCALLVFSVSPQKTLVFLIAVVILQQVESFTTYPVVVGKYVGLNGFWTMLSVAVWGGIFGFAGLVLGVPLTASLQELFRYRSLFTSAPKDLKTRP